MALATPTIESPPIDGTELNSTFMWETQNLDTLVISSRIISGTADSSSDPRFTIEQSHDRITWFGTTKLNNSTQSLEMAIRAPWMRVKLTTANSTAMRLCVTVALRQDSFTPEPSPASDPMLAISQDLVSGVTHINKFGRNPDCDQAAAVPAQQVGRDIWDGGVAAAAAWVPPTAARVHLVTSSDDEDNGAGTDTGALTARVFGLDDNFLEIQEDITLNGTTGVSTSLSYRMIYRIECLTFGSVGWNIGNLTAVAGVDATITAVVRAKNSQTLMAIYQIPAGKEGYITHWYGDLFRLGGQTKFADAFLMSKRFGGGWRVRGDLALGSDASGNANRKYTPYRKLEEKELVKIVADPSADGQDIGGGFDIILVDI